MPDHVSGNPGSAVAKAAASGRKVRRNKRRKKTSSEGLKRLFERRESRKSSKR